jgi:hypothetical protein
MNCSRRIVRFGGALSAVAIISFPKVGLMDANGVAKLDPKSGLKCLPEYGK